MAPPKEIIQIGQIEIRFLLDSDDTAVRLSMFEFLVPAGARVPAPTTTSTWMKSPMVWRAYSPLRPRAGASNCGLAITASFPAGPFITSSTPEQRPRARCRYSHQP